MWGGSVVFEGQGSVVGVHTRVGTGERGVDGRVSLGDLGFTCRRSGQTGWPWESGGWSRGGGKSEVFLKHRFPTSVGGVVAVVGGLPVFGFRLPNVRIDCGGSSIGGWRKVGPVRLKEGIRGPFLVAWPENGHLVGGEPR